MATQPVMRQRQQPAVTVDLAIISVALVWGINASVIKSALVGWNQLAFNAIRFSAAAILLFVYVVATDKNWRLSRQDFWRVALLGLIGNGLYQTLYIEAVPRTSASNISVIIAMSPLVVTLSGMLTGIERKSGWVMAAAAASVTGVIMVILGENGGFHLGGPNLTGDLISLAAMVCWAAYTVYARPVIDRVGSSLRVTAWAMLFGAISNSLIGIPGLLEQDFSLVTAASVWGMTYSALGSLLFGYVVFAWGVARLGGARTAIYTSLTPVFAAIIAGLFYSESWTLIQWTGAAIGVGGVALAKIQGSK
ncbi:MAG TPA: DMT family transporter [Symbiobacteriaceae bacterium]|nr:DMT family transporter [Symbiobacteriaceae bacterium]